MRIFSFLGVLLCSLIAAAGQSTQAGPAPKPDERYKADILVVVAHPDDETMVTGYLARAIYDQHKRVAVIFGTRGNGGGNAAGAEQAAALGAEREIEGRRALAHFDVLNVWFLNGLDTPGQDVLRSLETWDHGASLGQLVRLVRLTRPEVLMTWLPAYVAGENHGDHQAAGVLATEAFDAAGDPTKFPEQVSAPRDRFDIGNLTEGLTVWQPKKLYYFSDAAKLDFQEGTGPKYSNEDESPSKHVPYYRLAAEEMSAHLTQGDTGQMAKAAMAKGDFTYFRQPVRLTTGKSLVAGSKTGDVFEGITNAPMAFASTPGYQPAKRSGVWVELGGPWSYYEDFWRAHGLKLEGLLPRNEVFVGPGQPMWIPILIHNDTERAEQVALSAAIPNGWKELRGGATYPVGAHETYPVYFAFTAPRSPAPGGVDLKFDAGAAGSVPLRVYVTPGAMPQ